MESNQSSADPELARENAALKAELATLRSSMEDLALKEEKQGIHERKYYISNADVLPKGAGNTFCPKIAQYPNGLPDWETLGMQAQEYSKIVALQEGEEVSGEAYRSRISRQLKQDLTIDEFVEALPYFFGEGGNDMMGDELTSEVIGDYFSGV